MASFRGRIAGINDITCVQAYIKRCNLTEKVNKAEVLSCLSKKQWDITALVTRDHMKHRGFVFLTQISPGACIIKLIMTLIYGFRNELVFVPGKPFQPSLVFKDKHSSLLRKP